MELEIDLVEKLNRFSCQILVNSYINIDQAVFIFIGNLNGRSLKSGLKSAMMDTQLNFNFSCDSSRG